MIRIPGCIPIHGKDLLDPVQARKNEAYKWILHHAKRYALAEGVMVNSFMELEPGAIKSLQVEEPGKPRIYPVGPLVNMGSTRKVDGSGSECLTWLDGQPHGSVLFVSFGSGGTLSYDQINELALGLEMSEQRFLWVVRSPNDKVANANYFSVQSQKDPFDFLPKGFLERTKGRGLVVPSWAPQAEVLSHGSTVMLTEDIKVALRAKPSENGLVKREEIAKVSKALLEGEEGKKLRNQMKDLKDAAERNLSEDGASTKALSELAFKWNNTK
ncbi:hypothetical protein CMV_023464 [Castanea mollissima]|uniref:Uncharacterized protein n=1 Tax=Castanea mollissima TaxID=60419 RepID=A0A8J4VDG9_9ROSI|nr:hypothetical protein CMV_023464 [Castanea mollissima]